MHAGVFGDHRDGAESFLDPVLPILSFRWRTATSLAVLGTLETVDRHGFLEPLQATTYEITRPVEYGVQWIETRDGFSGEAFVNWQQLNTEEHREVFDYGLLLAGDPLPWLRLEGQLHGLHHGGQLYDSGDVANNTVWAAGARGHARLGGTFSGELAAFYLASSANLDRRAWTAPRSRATASGYAVASTAGRLGAAHLIWWRGTDFISHEGDHNYGSVGWRPGLLPVRARLPGAGLRASPHASRRTSTSVLEARLHRIDGEVEYSYRIVVRAPFELKIK